MHEGNVVTVEGRIMHMPKASALSARDFVLVFDLVFVKCAFKVWSYDRF